MELNSVVNLPDLSKEIEEVEVEQELNFSKETNNLKKQENKFDHFKKMELVKKINKIKKKEYLFNIFKIIKLHTENYNTNNNGTFIFFHNLPDEGYIAIENYVNNIFKTHKKSSNILNIFNSELSDTQNIYSETQNFYSDTIEVENEKELSNKEKIIMRRKKYEKYLDQNQER